LAYRFARRALDLFMVHRLRAKLLARQADLRNGRRPFPATLHVARLAAGRRRCSRPMRDVVTGLPPLSPRLLPRFSRFRSGK